MNRRSFLKTSTASVVIGVTNDEPFQSTTASQTPDEAKRSDDRLASPGIRTRGEGRVLFATIDAPPLNLLGPAMVRDLVALIQILEGGADYRVVVFESADPDFFIAHVDIAKMAEIQKEVISFMPNSRFGGLLHRFSSLNVVTIAQVEGRVRGVGSEFALACDMVFASRERAIFGQPEVGVGFIPGGGGVQHLTRSMGRKRALEVLLGAEDFSADLAERYGWINRSMPHAELRPFVTDFARRIASFPLAGISSTKKRVNDVALPSEQDMLIDAAISLKDLTIPEVQARLKWLFEHGMQTPGEVERNFGQALVDLPR